MCALLSAIRNDLLGPKVIGCGLLGCLALNCCASAVSLVIASEIDMCLAWRILALTSLGELSGGFGVVSGESGSIVVS